MKSAAEVIHLGGDVTDSGNGAILTEAPWFAEAEVTGDAILLSHRWQCDAVEAKAKAKKNSEAKKTDDVESYVYRNEEGVICIPGEYFRGSLIDPRNGAAKYLPDPRSPRKSALDLFRGGVLSLTDLAPIQRADGSMANEWDYIDRRRVVVQRAGITRSRPAFNAGWKCRMVFMITSPEYITPALFRQTLSMAGRLVGVGDFRPTFGRFSVTHFEVLKQDSDLIK